MMQGRARSWLVLAWRNPSELTEFARKVRLIGVAATGADVGQMGAFSTDDKLQSLIKTLNPLEVLGCKADGTSE